MKADQPGFYERHSNLLRIETHWRLCQALTDLGHMRAAFTRHRVLVMDDVFYHLRIIDDLDEEQGFRFVFCRTSALQITDGWQSHTAMGAVS